MVSVPPYFVYGSPGGELRFPTQNGRPVAISREAWEECCCEGGPCVVCAAATLPEWTAGYGFPTENVGALPYLFSGASLDGVTMHGDITSDGSSVGRVGSGGTGGAVIADTSLLVFPVVSKNFILTYEYFHSGEGKHWMEVRDSTEVNAAVFLVGSWGGAPTTQGIIGIGRHQIDSMCHQELPPAELVGLLPQTQSEWRERVLKKRGKFVTMEDGEADPVALSRCWVPVRGWVGLTLGPGVRVRNIRLETSLPE